MADIEKRETATATRDWLSHWFEEWTHPSSWPDLWRHRLLEGEELMRVEEFTEDDTLVVKAEMPGLDPDRDVTIEVTDHMLSVHAERRQESKVEEKGGYRSEFRYGSFSRRVPIPAGASERDVKATYKDGILEVRIPIDRAKAEAHKVPVERT
jgi:HSP20 family protein